MIEIETLLYLCCWVSEIRGEKRVSEWKTCPKDDDKTEDVWEGADVSSECQT